MRISKLFYLIWFVFCFLFFETKAQEETAFFQNYQVINGLPSNTVYDLAIDKTGFLWIATDSGLCRYDGQFFETFSSKDGLPDIEILDLFVDSKNRIWCNAYNGKIFYLEGGKVFSPDYYSGMKGCSGKFWQQIIECSDGGILIKTLNSLIRFNEESCSIIYKGHTDLIGSDEAGEWFIKTLYSKSKNVLEQYSLGDEEQLISSIPFDANIKNWTFKDSGIYGWVGKSIFKMTNGKLKFLVTTKSKHIDIEIARILDLQGYLWLATLNDGVYRIEETLEEPKTKHYLHDVAVTSVAHDGQGNFWFSSFGKGIFKLSHTDIARYDKLNGLLESEVSSFAQLKNSLVIGDMFNNIYNIDNNGIQRYNSVSKSQRNYNRIKGILEYKNDKLVMATDLGLTFLDLNNGEFSSYGKDLSFRDLYILNDSSLISLTFRYGAIRIMDPNTLVVNKNLKVNNPISVTQDKNDRIWIGTAEGLEYFDGYDFEHNYSYNLGKEDRINDLDARYDQVCVCSANQGLYIINSDSMVNITTEEGLATNNCNSIDIDENGIIWYATNYGLNRIEIEDLEVKTLELFDINSGLISNQIRKVEGNKGQVIVATPMGLQILDQSNMSNRIKQRTYINKIQVNDSIIRPEKSDTIRLPRNQNNITISYSNIDFNSRPLYNYQLVGHDQTEITTKSRDKSYYNLPHGEYKFRVKAASSSSLESHEYANISIFIQPKFWEQNWFKFLVVFFFMISLLLYLLNLKKRRERRLSLLRLKSEAELKALRAQINPHFLFNALNSIQDVILDKDTDMANEYIAQFSFLMRMILEQSKKPFVKLSDELKSLKLYLSLESLRFNDQFTTEIYVDPKLNKDSTAVPSCILQPLVENAIWHGLMQKKHNSLIIIRFEDSTNHTLIIIDDNGIGFNKTKTSKSNHVSNGLKNLKERLLLINGNLNENMTFRITKSVSATEEYPGSRIEITIPKELNELLH